MSERSRLRCAIYTRKSSEEGLDQAFNSLDAQREACEAYIASQTGLGWRLLKDRYDDRGLSGGSMQRPALQRLLHEIRQSRVNVVVVYKIDRLTRSLMDFARMVEIFDKESVSFVSVTQQFNTTTSMGRLTLNVLLSFAQFEREVTAERIRDKVAASKRKGMWMGGTVPLGYRAESRKLVVEPSAAAEVRRLFERYLELGSMPALAAEINMQRRQKQKSTLSSSAPSDPVSQPGTPPARIGSGQLTYLLSNPIYTGRVRHGEAIYAGEHQAIISDEVFETVQSRLADQAQRPRGSSVQPDIHLLTGLLVDGNGDRLKPTHAAKAGKRYRYYISSSLLKASGSEGKTGLRLPASELEALVVAELRKLFSDHPLLANWIVEAGQGAKTEVGLGRAKTIVDELAAQASPDRLRTILRSVLDRIQVSATGLKLLVDRGAVMSWLTERTATADPAEGRTPSGDGEQEASFASTTISRSSSGPDRSSKRLSSKTSNAADLHVIELAMSIRRRGVERRLVIEGQGAPQLRFDRPLIDTIAKAHVYLAALNGGRGLNRKQVAGEFGVHAEDISRLLPLAFLSPRILNAILTGRQPADLSVSRLTREIDLPTSWAAQGKLLGF